MDVFPTETVIFMELYVIMPGRWTCSQLLSMDRALVQANVPFVSRKMKQLFCLSSKDDQWTLMTVIIEFRSPHTYTQTPFQAFPAISVSVKINSTKKVFHTIITTQICGASPVLAFNSSSLFVSITLLPLCPPST